MNRLNDFNFCNKIFKIRKLNFSSSPKLYKSPNDGDKHKIDFQSIQTKANETNHEILRSNKSVRIFGTYQDAGLSKDQGPKETKKQRDIFDRSHDKATKTYQSYSNINKSNRLFETERDIGLNRDQTSPSDANKQRDEFKRVRGNIEKNQTVSNAHDLIYSAGNQQPVDWLSKLSQNSNSDSVNIDQKYSHIKKYVDLSVQEKTDLINKQIAALSEKPSQNIIDKHWDELMELKSYRKMKETIEYMQKKSFYQRREIENKSKRLEEVKEKQRSNLERLDKEKFNVLPTFNKILPPSLSEKCESYLKRSFINKLVANHVNPKENSLPKIIFDFRYTNDETSIVKIKSYLKQYNECVSINMKSKEPFKLMFYNYSFNSMFHAKFSNLLTPMFNRNFMDVHEHNYLRDFDKRDLIYLSADAKDDLEYFDPTKTYIIGSIIDEPTPKFKFATVTTARREGIRVQKLPLDRHIKMQSSKNLNMNHVLMILQQLYSDDDIRQAIIECLPRRKIMKVYDEENVFEKDFKQNFLKASMSKNLDKLIAKKKYIIE